jgi:peptidoglycan/xylan/chitin deacetylase (PgdA/CDA1 family)/ubiquinone/menaquinone biosynthesis C-methylase UbiE
VSGEPRTSFVIAARNAVHTLAQALDSVLAQSEDDWEALVIDDGSSDDTPALVAGYAKQDARFVALRGSGSGVSAARNAGLRQARGRYLVFLDSDDWIAPQHLERLHAALAAAPGATAAYCDRQRVMPDGDVAPVHSEPRIAEAPLDMFARSCAVAIHAVLVERDAALRAGGFDTTLRTCEDWDLWQRIARQGGRWVHVAEPLVFYRTSANSLSQDTQRVLADAATVVRRGFAAGASRAHGATPESALAYFALWCCAVEAARGRDSPGLRDGLGPLPAGSDHARHIAIALVDAVVVGLLAVPRRLAARWAEYGPRVTALISALGVMWQDATAARRVQYAFERLLLQYDDLAAPRPLALTLGLRVDLRSLTAITPPAGIDRFYVYLCDGDDVLAVAEPGTLGAFAPRQWIELAAHHLGWERVMALTRRTVARGVTPRRLADAARSVRATLQRRAPRDTGSLALWKAVAQDALLAAAAPSAGSGGHGGELQGLREQAERTPVAPVSLVPEADASRRETGAAQAHGRRDFWEDFFREPDPWNYGSAYEQEKYSRQLELLPDGPIESALELACAEGHFTATLAPRTRRLIATDISATALERAAERCRGHAHVEFRQLDLSADALPQGLDLIVCSEVLYFLSDEAELRQVAARLAAALKPGGHLVMAHALLLKEDMTRTGFDWDHPWGATTILRVFAELLTLERSLRTELYRIDRFVRAESSAAPRVETRPIEAEIEHAVARFVVWGGATARRTELARTEQHQRLPVLAYHRIADSGPAALARWRVGAAAFEAQLRWLRRNGYHAIVSDELAWFLQHQHAFVGRPLMITFDDGYQDFAETAWPLLRRHDFRAEVFVVTDLVGGCAEWDRSLGEPAALMAAQTIAALAGQGARFGSHLASHRGADGLSTRELVEELLRSQRCLAQWTGLAPCAMAAPHGLTDQRLQGLARECGYRLGFGTASAATSLADEPMQLPRIEIRGDMAMEEFVARMEESR